MMFAGEKKKKEVTSLDLRDAVAFGEVHMVQELLDNPKSNPTAPGPDGKTPLQIAVEIGNLEIVEMLLQQPSVEPYATVDKYLRTPLHIAAWKGHGPIVEALLATRPSKEDQVEIEVTSSKVVTSTESSNPKIVSPLPAAVAHSPDLSQISIVELSNFPLVSSIVAPQNVTVEISSSTVESHKGIGSQVPADRNPTFMDVNAKARELFDESPWTSPELLAQERSIWLGTGFTPLHLASWSGSEEVVRILLADPETDLDAVTMDGFTPLHMAADRGHEGVVHLLLEEHKNRKPERLMHYGLKFNSERDMRYMNPERDERMLKFKDFRKPTTGNGPTNALDCAGRTPLHYASRQGRAMTVIELLEWNDTFVNAPDADGLLPMHMAAREGHVEVVELLLYEYHWAPVILKGLLETLDTKVRGLKDLTISEGFHLELLPRPDLSDTFTRITDGSTPLHLASVQGHSQVVLKLLKYLDIRAQNVKQETALDLVVKRLQENNWENCIKLIEVFKILLICMPRVNSISDMDINFVKRLQLNSDLGRENLLWKLDALHASTLLHWAAATGSAYLVQLLLVQPGMDINAVDESEKFTPLHFAARSGHTDVVKLLTAQERLSLNEEDWLGRTALQIAAEKNEQLKWKGKKLPEALNPFAGIIEISWRDVEKLLLEQPDVMNYISFLYRDRQVFVDAANAILVGSALIATISYGGWITPPLGYISYYHTQVYTQCTNYPAII